ncbi:MAG: FHA domain-containing protein [Myxococcota bacterium]|nr:FHA domain-containing protein [Myxococcota bacterium]
MANIRKMVRNSKVHYDSFTKYVSRCSLHDYLLTFRYPFLVGCSLYEGELLKQTNYPVRATFRFKPFLSEFVEVYQDSAVNRSLFVLRKDEESLPGPFFTIGRHANNTISIVDYAVSKEHAVIQKHKEKGYFLVDRGSTNGTCLNGERIDSNKPYHLSSNDVISFGRFGFMLMRPISLFIKTRCFLNMESSLKKELREILKIIKFRSLIRVAQKNKIPWKYRSEEDLREELCDKVPVIDFLDQLC